MTDGTLTIGQLSRRTGATLRTLRFYEDIGLLRPARTATRRLYSAECLRRLERILTFARYGFALSQIKTMLEKTDRELREILADRLEEFDREITTQHENLSALRQEIARIDREWAA